MSDTRREPEDERWPLDESVEAPSSGDFVETTLGRIRADPDVRLSILLAAYRVPEPSSDFVARTVVRVTTASTPVPAPRPRWPVLLAAAAILIAGGLWLVRPAATVPRDATTTFASFAAALGQHAARHPHESAPPLDGFFGAVSFAENDGVVLFAGGAR